MPFCYIGSVAANSLGYSQLRRDNPIDIDAIADYDTALAFLKKMNCHYIYPINQGRTLVGKNGKQIYEVSIAWPNSLNAELLEYLGDATTAPLDVLYTLKMSHRYLRNSPHFYKTMIDIKAMRHVGAKIPGDLIDWFKRREKETYDYKHPSLAQKKNNFFSDDGVKYQYDHDSLHKAIAVKDEPMYTRYQKDGEEVACDRVKWENLPDSYKQIAVMEEAGVLALERSLIPFPGKWTEQQAFEFALMKVCTSITSGWFREYAWENHDEILELALEYPYYSWFKLGLSTGTVKLYANHN